MIVAAIFLSLITAVMVIVVWKAVATVTTYPKSSEKLIGKKGDEDGKEK